MVIELFSIMILLTVMLTDKREESGKEGFFMAGINTIPLIISVFNKDIGMFLIFLLFILYWVLPDVKRFVKGMIK